MRITRNGQLGYGFSKEFIYWKVYIPKLEKQKQTMHKESTYVREYVKKKLGLKETSKINPTSLGRRGKAAENIDADADADINVKLWLALEHLTDQANNNTKQ